MTLLSQYLAHMGYANQSEDREVHQVVRRKEPRTMHWHFVGADEDGLTDWVGCVAPDCHTDHDSTETVSIPPEGQRFPI